MVVDLETARREKKVSSLLSARREKKMPLYKFRQEGNGCLANNRQSLCGIVKQEMPKRHLSDFSLVAQREVI